MKSKTNRLTFSALLVAIMLVLGYIESLIPIPGVPGMKLGLANSVLMLALYWLGAPTAWLLMVVKVLLSGLLFGGVGAMLYSFAGGVLSLAIMTILVYVVKGFGTVGVGVAGAVGHNAGQIIMAMLILQTTSLLYYLAVLMVVGVITGAATGLLTSLLIKRIPTQVRDKVKRNKETDKEKEE